MLKNESVRSIRAGKHLSASALKTFLTCPWKFKLQYVEGVAPEFRPSALVLGKSVHEALAIHHLALMEGKPVSANEVQARFDSALDLQLREEVPISFKANEDVDLLRETGRGLVAVYLEESVHDGSIIAVEQGWRADLINPRTGELSDVALVGVFDLVEKNGEEQLVIAEIKTAARKWSPGQVDLDLQGSLYAEAIAQAGLVPEGREAVLRYDVVVKNKKPVLDRRYAVRRPGDRELARVITWDALQAIEAGAFYRNPGWQCDGCPFRRQCGV